MKCLQNPFRGRGMPHRPLADFPWTSVAVDEVRALLSRCPRHARTPLLARPDLARSVAVGAVHLKDERERMGLGSFKALGAAYVIARDAARGRAEGRTYVTASAGNHGLSVAAGAEVFGARAVIYIAETVDAGFADRLAAFGAEVRREGPTYEDAVAAATAAAEKEDMALLSDTSWTGYVDRPFRVMEGYTALMAEIIEDIPAPPTHIFLQAGVGGLAAACAAMARDAWGAAPRILVVEPQAAPALQASIAAGQPVVTSGPVSSMGRLDCKEPSIVALKSLARDADHFLTISETEALHAVELLHDRGLETSASGAAGVAALLAGMQDRDLGLDDSGARVLAILSEGPAA